MIRKLLVIGAMAVLAVSGAKASSDFPNRPIRVIDAYSAGGSSDIAMRLLVDAFGRALGQTVYVENKPGAGGLIGTGAFLSAPPDGYTLMIGTGAIMVVLPAARASVPYDPEKDFVPLGKIWQTPQVLAVAPKLRVSSLSDFIARAKSSTGHVTMGSAGVGTVTHLSLELLKREAKAPITHVPFKGTGNSLSALLAGQIDGLFGDSTMLAPHVQSKAVTALAVTGPSRSPLLPDLPTAAEAGMPALRTTTTFGLVAPGKTPPEVVARLRRALAQAIEDPAYRKNLATRGVAVQDWSAAAFAQWFEQERKQWPPLIREAGIKMD